MNLFPFKDSAKRANERIQMGFTVFQQWKCHWCHAKQTMPDPNHYYEKGICEECGETTDIERDGCNFMTVAGVALEEIEK